MNIARKGKIARLPQAIRGELNERLLDGESGPPLMKWLNSLPEVRAVLAEEFGGEPISKQNLSAWRQGGYEAWLQQQEALKIGERILGDADALSRTTEGPLSDVMAGWLTARYLVATKRRLDQGKGGKANWNLLREFCSDLHVLRRGDHLAQRLEFEREKVRAGLARGAGARTEENHRALWLEQLVARLQEARQKEDGGAEIPHPIRIQCERGEGETIPTALDEFKARSQGANAGQL